MLSKMLSMTFTLELTPVSTFFGLSSLSDYHKIPHENAEDCSVTLVSKSMSRQTFRYMKTNLHLCDNSIVNKDDKLYKVCNYIDILNKNFFKFGVFSHNFSINEQMVPYFGRHSCKMFMKGKPIRFGFKVWCLCSSDGYLFHFLPYADQSDFLMLTLVWGLV